MQNTGGLSRGHRKQIVFSLRRPKMTTVYKAEGVKALQEIIESQPIDRIQGRPDCHTLINLLNSSTNYVQEQDN